MFFFYVHVWLTADFSNNTQNEGSVIITSLQRQYRQYFLYSIVVRLAIMSGDIDLMYDEITEPFCVLFSPNPTIRLPSNSAICVTFTHASIPRRLKETNKVEKPQYWGVNS